MRKKKKLPPHGTVTESKLKREMQLDLMQSSGKLKKVELWKKVRSLIVRSHFGKMASKLTMVILEITQILRTKPSWRMWSKVMYQKSFKKSTNDRFLLDLRIKELRCTNHHQHHMYHFPDKRSLLEVARLLKHRRLQKLSTFKTNKTNQLLILTNQQLKSVFVCTMVSR